METWLAWRGGCEEGAEKFQGDYENHVFRKDNCRNRRAKLII
jgi:hypothetical protein